MGVQRNRPSMAPDGTQVSPDRASAYSDAYVQVVGTPRGSLAEEGSYFTANNATTATEITAHVSPVVADEPNKPLLHLYNGGQKFITIDQISLRTETVNDNTTDVYYVVYTAPEHTRDSGGTQLTVNNCRSDNPFQSGAVVYFGAVVTTASTSKLIARTLTRQTINVTEDREYFQFGERIGSGPAYIATISDIYRYLPPCVIAPGHSFHFMAVHPAGDTNASTYEVMLGFWER